MKKLLHTVLLLAVPVILAGQGTAADYLMKARSLVDSGRPGEAVSLLTGALEKYRLPSLFLYRAEANITGKDFSAAIADLNSANETDPLSGEYGLARVYALRGDAATALYHLELSMNSAFRKTEKEILLDPSFRSLENRSEWRQFWRKDWYSRLEKGLSEIEFYSSNGNTDDARNILRDISSAYPGDERVKYSSALISLSESKYQEAVKILSDLISGNPVNEKYLRLMARAQYGSGNYSGASDTYTDLIGLNIPDPELLIQRSECYRKTGQTDKAIEDIEKYLSYYPGSKQALSLAGRVESASGDNIKALSYFTENIRLHPNDPECYIDRANSYLVSRSWNWALQDYGMSLDLQPGNPDVWLNRGVALVNLGKTEDACTSFKKSFSLGNKKATEYLSKYCIR